MILPANLLFFLHTAKGTNKNYIFSTRQKKLHKRFYQTPSVFASNATDVCIKRYQSVTSLSIEIKAEGLIFTGETENGFSQISPLWGAGDSIAVEAFEREGDSTPYVKGNFVIDSLEQSAPAQDDATYSISLKNDDEPEVYPGKPSAEE